MRIVMILAGLLVSTAAVAAERVIELSDGSRILGDVVSMQNDTFTVRTRLLGTLTIKASQIANMTTPHAGKTPAPKQAHVGAGHSRQKSGAIASIESGIVGNANLMSDILRLQNDPNMKAVLADPKLMKAVQDLDFDKLSKDPRIKALMNNPSVKDIQSGIH